MQRFKDDDGHQSRNHGHVPSGRMEKWHCVYTEWKKYFLRHTQSSGFITVFPRTPIGVLLWFGLWYKGILQRLTCWRFGPQSGMLRWKNLYKGGGGSQWEVIRPLGNAALGRGVCSYMGPWLVPQEQLVSYRRTRPCLWIALPSCLTTRSLSFILSHHEITHCSSYYFPLLKKKKKSVTNATQGRERLIWATVWVDTARHGWGGTVVGAWGSWLYCVDVDGQEAERDTCWCFSAVFFPLLSFSSGPQRMGMQLPTFRALRPPQFSLSCIALTGTPRGVS